MNSIAQEARFRQRVVKEHTQAEKEMILRRYPYYKNDMIALWDSLRKSGYTRSYGSMIRVIKKWVNPEIKKRTARKPKPYARAWYPGQKVQVDVKFVPSECVVNGVKYYQYTITNIRRSTSVQGSVSGRCTTSTAPSVRRTSSRSC